MPSKRSHPAEITPAGQLAEARLHFVLGYQLAQATIVTTALFEQQIGEPLALRPVEYTLLALIAENPGGSHARLARALAVTSPNITSWVDKLEKRGLVRRQQSESDRRLHNLQATPQGLALAREATDRILQAEKDALSALSPGERLILVELLHKVAFARGERASAGTGAP
ncbi:MAG TPA: MarR family transcriptional regulator [Ramlibacter sp.]|nr:MarR family transcriptional regulator [Ramlibacter sp.]